MLSLRRSEDELIELVTDLRSRPQEEAWLEFKTNFAEPAGIGEYISALANSAALMGSPVAYLVWGVSDADHEIVGTGFDLRLAKKGNENLENWLVRLLDPQIVLRYDQILIDGKPVGVLEIEAAVDRPIRFQKAAFVRVGNYKKRLDDHPELERELWRTLESVSFEDGVATDRLQADEVLRLLDYPSYFELVDHRLPADSRGILEALAAGKVIKREASAWAITNVGALMFAKKLSDFDRLARKAPRVIKYRGNNRVVTEREQIGTRGYASGFAGLISYIDGLLPTNEVIGQALRTTVPMYPALAVRELVANALIHQDFSRTGTGPTIELFDDRFEISNPGTPLIDPSRFVDARPLSRNERLAWMMRQCHICEERGSGWDKVVSEVELHQLPAPTIRIVNTDTVVTMYAPMPLNKMSKDDRVRAVYQHACLRYVSNEPTTNTSVRARFGIEDRNSATASRLISDAITAGLIVPADAGASRKHMSYVPVWAVSAAEPI